MRMIAGGTAIGWDVVMDGEVMNDVDARERDVAMVFQAMRFIPI